MRAWGWRGYAEGGLVAFYAAAADTAIDAALVSGYFDARERVWAEPIYRNVWGLLEEFGDAELATLIAPRALVVEYCRPAGMEERQGRYPRAIARERARRVRAHRGPDPPGVSAQGVPGRRPRLRPGAAPLPRTAGGGAGNGYRAAPRRRRPPPRLRPRRAPDAPGARTGGARAGPAAGLRADARRLLPQPGRAQVHGGAVVHALPPPHPGPGAVPPECEAVPRGFLEGTDGPLRRRPAAAPPAHPPGLRHAAVAGLRGGAGCLPRPVRLGRAAGAQGHPPGRAPTGGGLPARAQRGAAGHHRGRRHGLPALRRATGGPRLRGLLPPTTSTAGRTATAGCAARPTG